MKSISFDVGRTRFIQNHPNPESTRPFQTDPDRSTRTLRHDPPQSTSTRPDGSPRPFHRHDPSSTRPFHLHVPQLTRSIEDWLQSQLTGTSPDQSPRPFQRDDPQLTSLFQRHEPQSTRTSHDLPHPFTQTFPSTSDFSFRVGGPTTPHIPPHVCSRNESRRTSLPSPGLPLQSIDFRSRNLPAPSRRLRLCCESSPRDPFDHEDPRGSRRHFSPNHDLVRRTLSYKSPLLPSYQPHGSCIRRTHRSLKLTTASEVRRYSDLSSLLRRPFPGCRYRSRQGTKHRGGTAGVDGGSGDRTPNGLTHQ